MINVGKPWCQYVRMSKRTAWLYDWQQLAQPITAGYEGSSCAALYRDVFNVH